MRLRKSCIRFHKYSFSAPDIDPRKFEPVVRSCAVMDRNCYTACISYLLTGGTAAIPKIERFLHKTRRQSPKFKDPSFEPVAEGQSYLRRGVNSSDLYLTAMALGVHIAEYGIHQGEARWLYFAGNKQGPEAETIYLSFEMTTDTEAHSNLVIGVRPR